jgi:hypothetical protein
MSTATHFSDAVAQVSLTGQLVRIEFGTVVLGQAEGAEVPANRLAPTQVLVMPVQGFVQGLALQQQALKRLIDDGVVTSGESVNGAAERS